GRLRVEVTQRAPIDVLAPCDGREHRVAAPFGFVLERGDRNVEDRKYQVVATERRLASEEGFELELAVCAVDGPRGHDGNEKDRLVDRALDLRFPHLSGSDRRLILPQTEARLGAAKLRAQLALDAVPQRGQHSLEGPVILARIAEEPDKLRKIRQRGHRARALGNALQASRKRRGRKRSLGTELFSNAIGPACLPGANEGARV